jgi:nucleotide-binding universal stress UspA family protein
MSAYQPRRLLIATDLAGVAERAIVWGVEVARRYDASITLLHADRFEPPMRILQSSISGSYAAIEQRRTEALARVEALAKRLIPESISHEVLVARELPATAIVENAARLGCDLIVMGSRARKGWHAILGSETELVMYQTTIPLLAVRSQPAGETVEPPRIRNVLCPVNYTPVALESLRHAASLAAAFEAELLVVHVEEDDSDSLDRVKAWVPHDLPIAPKFCEKPPARNVAEQVIATVNSEQADLVVVGAQHRHFADSTVIGMTTTRLLRHSPVPVLTTFRRSDRQTR